MKAVGLMVGIILIISFSYAQEGEPVIPNVEETFERYAEREEAESEDDNEFLRLTDLSKYKINLNFADAQALRELPGITEILIINFLEYREKLNLLSSIYELQAVPGWNIGLIINMLPYITVSEENSIKKFRNGNYEMLIRGSIALASSNDEENNFAGSGDKVMMRLRYKTGKNFQYGFLAEKDAGEKIEFKNNKPGMDFFSGHLIIRNSGKFKQVAIGDYTINLGQGLIQWQSLSFAKSAEITSVKKLAEKIRPYTSAGEYNFHRGLAVQLEHKAMNVMFYYSNRNLSANISEDSVTTIYTYGLHRTEKEIAVRNNLNMKAMGLSIGFRKKRFELNINGIRYQFSIPLTKNDEPYNIFAIRDNNWMNISADYSYIYKNMHVFGEVATDKFYYSAQLHGALISVHRNVDVSLLYRKISPGYQSMFNTAFTENTKVNNETGYFSGISIRPVQQIKIDAFFDIFRFPWLKYRTDHPSEGYEQMFKLTYKPARNIEYYLRYLQREKMQNLVSDMQVAQIKTIRTTYLRSNFSMQVNKTLAIKNRVEFSRYKAESDEEHGFLAYIDLSVSPQLSPFKWNVRLQCHFTEGYNSRIYAYETDLPGSGRVMANSGAGYRLIINMRVYLKTLFPVSEKKPNNIQFAFRPAVTIHPKIAKIQNIVQVGNKRKIPELKIQIIYKL